MPPTLHDPDRPGPRLSPHEARLAVRRLLFAVKVGTPKARVTARRTLIEGGLAPKLIDDLLRPAA